MSEKSSAGIALLLLALAAALVLCLVQFGCEFTEHLGGGGPGGG